MALPGMLLCSGYIIYSIQGGKPAAEITWLDNDNVPIRTGVESIVGEFTILIRSIPTMINDY